MIFNVSNVGWALVPTREHAAPARSAWARVPTLLAAVVLAAQLTLPSFALAQQPTPPATADAASVQQQTAAAPAPSPAQPAAPMFPGPAQSAQSAPAAGSLLQTIVSLLFVLALVVGLAWFLKRFGPRAIGGAANMRVIGSLSLGGRERVMLVEVADQWIVVGAAPGRVNVLATMPKQEGVEPPAPMAAGLPSGFADWLKQTIDKRNAK